MLLRIKQKGAQLSKSLSSNGFLYPLINYPASAADNNPTSLVTLDRITFNYGREIFVYPYRGVRKAADLTKPIDKRIYKGMVSC